MKKVLIDVYHRIPLSVRKVVFFPVRFAKDSYTDFMKVYRRKHEFPKKVSYGQDNPDKIFFVTHYAVMGGGLFGLVNFFVGEVKLALEKGYVPLIDMQSVRQMYLPEEKVGKENAFEYYYEQPFDMGLDDISHSKNVVFGFNHYHRKHKDLHYTCIFDKEFISSYHEIYTKYFRLNKKTAGYVETKKTELFAGKKVLGVLSRGSDYRRTRPKNHPVQPEPADFFDKIDEAVKEHGYEKIFLCTEDKEYYDIFVARYGDMIVTNQKSFYGDTGDKLLAQISFDDENGEYVAGLEYLTTIHLLARCNGIIAGICGGSIAAAYISDGFEYEHYFDMGTYR